MAIKDNTSVAGLPFTGGTHEYHLSKDTPYPIPDIDATVVSRVLENGGTILGTSTCENYCFSALSFTSATGPVDNPWMKGHACGGSSSGSAALIAVKAVRKFNKGNTPSADDDGLGEGVDFAIGGDQGGSIRLVGCLSLSACMKQEPSDKSPASSVLWHLRLETHTRAGSVHGSRSTTPYA